MERDRYQNRWLSLFDPRTPSKPLVSVYNDLIRRYNDETYIMDIDISILGAAKEVFEQHESQIREEYHWVPLEIYRRERERLWESFLAADRIFRTDHFHETCEKQAGDNIKTSLIFVEKC